MANVSNVDYGEDNDTGGLEDRKAHYKAHQAARGPTTDQYRDKLTALSDTLDFAVDRAKPRPKYNVVSTNANPVQFGAGSGRHSAGGLGGK
jgi:hypothetical protein